jgi:hypothetical protein
MARNGQAPDRAAKLPNASRCTVEAASHVLRRGVHERIKAVDQR